MRIYPRRIQLASLEIADYAGARQAEAVRFALAHVGGGAAITCGAAGPVYITARAVLVVLSDPDARPCPRAARRAGPLLPEWVP